MHHRILLDALASSIPRSNEIFGVILKGTPALASGHNRRVVAGI